MCINNFFLYLLYLEIHLEIALYYFFEIVLLLKSPLSYLYSFCIVSNLIIFIIVSTIEKLSLPFIKDITETTITPITINVAIIVCAVIK